MSVVRAGMVWQPRRDFGVVAGASSSSSSSASVASLQDSSPSFTITWQVEQAQTPPHAWSRPALTPSEMSRMLPGMPLCPYGILSGSTSMVLPLGRNVTLYFFVAGLYFIFSISGVVPPTFFCSILLNGGAAVLRPYEIKPLLAFGLAGLLIRRCS